HVGICGAQVRRVGCCGLAAGGVGQGTCGWSGIGAGTIVAAALLLIPAYFARYSAGIWAYQQAKRTRSIGRTARKATHWRCGPGRACLSRPLILSPAPPTFSGACY